MKFRFILILNFFLISCVPYLNLYEIDDGNVWRSSQLRTSEFEHLIRNVGIKTIINLRGENPSQTWYQEELALSKKYGVKLINISMSAKRYPHASDLVKLLDAFRDAPRPLLIHCKAGADRTGEALAIYQMEYMDLPKQEALKMLSPKYFHIAKFTPAKESFIKLYRGEEWARKQYDPCKSKYKYYDQNKYCRKGPFKRSAEAPDSDT